MAIFVYFEKNLLRAIKICGDTFKVVFCSHDTRLFLIPILFCFVQSKESFIKTILFFCCFVEYNNEYQEPSQPLHGQAKEDFQNKQEAAKARQEAREARMEEQAEAKKAREEAAKDRRSHGHSKGLVKWGNLLMEQRFSVFLNKVFPKIGIL